MPRTFIYARVSTIEQEPENQIREIEAAGFTVEPHRIVRETVSGSVALGQRKGFALLIDKMEGRLPLYIFDICRYRAYACHRPGEDI